VKDRQKTELLTKIGYLQLTKMECKYVSTEVTVPWYLIKELDSADVYVKNRRHTRIDLVGIQFEYLPLSKQYTEKVYIEVLDKEIGKKVIKKPILRGIEIKVSRSDLKNGFIHLGCHYNYLMTPKGLIKSKNEIDKRVGIIEVDLDIFEVKKYHPPFSGISDLVGLKIIRRPKRSPVSEVAVERVLAQIPRTLTNQTRNWLVKELERSKTK